jgi:PKD repeat protein
VLVFVSQTTSAGENAMARSLGVSTGSFINTLIQLVNLIFGALSILLFILAIVGMFRLFMARKDDKETRKKGLTMAGVSGLLLLVTIIIWVGIYMYMSSKRVPIEAAPTTGFITEPAETLLLTAPITIKFDASAIPVDDRKYDILGYLWDFGDGNTSTSVTASHSYEGMGENQGRFDVRLQITARDKTTDEEIVDTYTRTVTIANIALSARFTADPEKGPAPLEVTFNASDSAAPAGEIVSYEWDFDNNNVFTDDSGVEVTHEFAQVGTYQVNLRVTDNTGNFEVTDMEIVVEGANVPTAVIEIPTEDGNYFAGKQYTFEGEKSSSPSGKITKYEWDFGDGSSKATTRTATHTYKTAGTYEVILTIEDEADKEAEGSKKIDVEMPAAAPIAVIKSVPEPEGDADFISNSVPFEVSFDGRDSSDNDDNIVEYNWDFDGDGSTDASGGTVTYAYKKSGTFNATLTVIDADDNESSAILVVKAGEQPLTARVTAEPLEGTTPLTVDFDASSSSYPSGEIVSYEWDFGDGSPTRIDASSVTYYWNLHRESNRNCVR